MKEDEKTSTKCLGAISNLITLRPDQKPISSSPEFLVINSIVGSSDVSTHIGKATQNFMAWGLSFLEREKRACKYFFKRGFFLSALMFAIIAASTDFYWATLSALRTFFYAPSAKNALASAALVLLSLAKVLSEIFEMSTPLMSTLALVAMVYTWLTRLMGTPFTL